PRTVVLLGAFASAIILGGIDLFIAGASVNRLLNPLPIHFNDAILVACVGLCVNVISALLLKDQHHHGHSHGDSRGHGHAPDLNLKAAYVHVLADAVTSLLAIAALTGGKFFGCSSLDPIMGVVGSAVIAQWAYALLRDTSPILLDKE